MDLCDYDHCGLFFDMSIGYLFFSFLSFFSGKTAFDRFDSHPFVLSIGANPVDVGSGLCPHSKDRGRKSETAAFFRRPLHTSD